MAQNSWLYFELKKKNVKNMKRIYEPFIEIEHGADLFRIYAPSSDEYIITVDVVEKVAELGGNTISYADSWQSVSKEAGLRAKELSIAIWPHGRTLNFFS